MLELLVVGDGLHAGVHTCELDAGDFTSNRHVFAFNSHNVIIPPEVHLGQP
jgi:hypothetical protein